MPRRHSPHTTQRGQRQPLHVRGPPWSRQLHQQSRSVPLHASELWAKGAPPGNVDRLDLEDCRGDALSSVDSPLTHTRPPHVNISRLPLLLHV
jgi:hypothetical protein